MSTTEATRNKALLCRYIHGDEKCPFGASCPFAHYSKTERRTVPSRSCQFQSLPSGCLRDDCPYFHGDAEQLKSLRVSQAKSYCPAAFMKVATEEDEARYAAAAAALGKTAKTFAPPSVLVPQTNPEVFTASTPLHSSHPQLLLPLTPTPVLQLYPHTPLAHTVPHHAQPQQPPRLPDANRTATITVAPPQPNVPAPPATTPIHSTEPTITLRLPLSVAIPLLQQGYAQYVVGGANAEECTPTIVVNPPS